MSNQGQVSTHPEHDCHEPMQQHWHMQNGVYTYSTCGVCQRITKIEKAPELAEKDAQLAELRANEAAWQAMCNSFVGLSMLADEFADEPHDPEAFGGYVKNLGGQIETLRAENEVLGEQVLGLSKECSRYREALEKISSKRLVSNKFDWRRKLALKALTSSGEEDKEKS